jgi:ribosomal protein S27E
MPLKVTCPDCFRDYKVQDQHVGKKFRCKGCGAIVTAKAPKPKPKAKVVDDYDDWEEYDSDETDGTGFGEDDGYLPPPPKPRSRAVSERRPPRRKKKAARGTSELPLPLPMLICGGLMLVLLGMSFITPIAGALLLGILFLTSVVLMLHGGLRMLITPFQEDIVCGLLYLFVPFYWLYYVITRWDEMSNPFLTALGGWLLMFLGSGLAQVMFK